MNGILAKLKRRIWNFQFFLYYILKKILFGRSERNGVLILRWDRVGDAVVWLPFAVKLVEFYHRQGKKVTLLCCAEMVGFYRKTVGFDDYIEFDAKAYMTDVSACRRMLNTVCERHFAILVNPRVGRELLIDDMIAVAAGCEISYALEARERLINPCLQRLIRRCYTNLLEVPAGVTGEIEFAELLNREITGSGAGTAEPYRRMAEFKGPEIPGKYYVVMPGSYDSFRCWPKDKYIEIIRWLADYRPDLTAVLAGNRGEQLDETNGNILDFTGRTDLPELIGLLGNAEFVIGNESGGIHLAAALGVKSFCLAGYGHWKRFIPYLEPYPVAGVAPPVLVTAEKCLYSGCNWKCRFFTNEQRRCPCIDDIEVSVLAAEIRKGF